MKKILIGYLNKGLGSGINKYIDSFANSVNNEETQIDFLTRETSQDINDYVKNNGFNNLYVVSRNRRPIKQLCEMIKIIKKNKYDIAYFNISESFNCIGIIAAKICGVKKIVIHSHSSGADDSNFLKRKLKTIVNAVFKPVLTLCGNEYLACSKNAAKWIYTKSIIEDKDYKIVYNSVDYDRFKVNEATRSKIRNELGLNDKFVIGHVGRFSYQKNHIFLLDTLKKVFNEKTNSVAILIGEGELEEKIKEYATKLNIIDKIIFLNNIPNVNEYMQSFDVLLLPSKFEGLPIVGIEGQLAGLPCLFSDKISNEVIIGDNSKLLSTKDSNLWKDSILGIDKRENKLLENAKNYMLSNSEKQFEEIADCNNVSEENKKTFGLSFFLKIILSIHFLLNLTSYANGFNYLMVPSAILMLLIVILNVKNKEKIIKNKKYWLLGFFLISYLFTFIINTKYNVVGTIKTLIWSIIHFVFVFGYYDVDSKKQAKRELKWLLIIMLAVVSIINIDNLLMLLNRTTKLITSFEGELHYIGLTKWGRFYGNFYDPNYSSVICSCGAIFALYLFRKSKKIPMKIALILTLILQIGYIFFGESRSGLVAFAVAIFTYIIGRWLYISKNRKVVNLILQLICGVVIIVVLPKTTLKLYNKMVDTDNNENVNTEQTEEKDKKEDKVEDKKEDISIGRQDNKQDISNRRFDIWKSGGEIFSHNFIWGVGFPNILYIAKDKFPGIYIVNNDLADFDAFHNVVIDIGVAQGLIGLTIAFIFAIYILKDTIKNWKDFMKEDAEEKVMIISCLVSVLASAMFLSEIFYINNACTFIFWLLFGYYNYYLDRSKNEK